jgi:hypothetical protein
MLTLKPNINILYHVTVLKENVMSTAHAYITKKFAFTPSYCYFCIFVINIPKLSQKQLILYILCFVDRATRYNCVNKNQLDAQLILSIFCQPLHILGVSRPIIRRYNCMYTNNCCQLSNYRKISWTKMSVFLIRRNCEFAK